MEIQDHGAFMKVMKERIDKELESFFRDRESSSLDPVCRSINEHIKDFTMNGGKRVRPIMVVLGHDLFAEHDPAVYKAAISMELTQTYLLIHDDIMDQSEIRRGKPSLHVSVRHQLGDKVKESRRISENMAIVAGDLADSFAHQALLNCGMSPPDILKANMELSRIIEMTGYGQLIDIDSANNDSFEQRDLLRLHILKTARYTIEGPLMMGALLSGTTEDIKPLSYYGTLLGTAFQLHDDILGLFGEEAETGKSIKSDVNEGKKTLLMLKAMEKSSPADRKFIMNCLSSGNVSDGDFEKLRSIVKSSGSYDYSRNMMQMMIEKSKEYLSMVKGDPQIKEFLNWFAHYIIERKS